MDDEFTNFGVRLPGGHAGMRHIVTVWRAAFPDLHYEIQEEIVHDDKTARSPAIRCRRCSLFLSLTTSPIPK